jgi:hypothetical protein
VKLSGSDWHSSGDRVDLAQKREKSGTIGTYFIPTFNE